MKLGPCIDLIFLNMISLMKSTGPTVYTILENSNYNCQMGGLGL
jgi:predicted sugar kinase